MISHGPSSNLSCDAFKFPPSPEFLYTFYCYFTLLSPYFLIFSFIYKCGDLWEVQNVFACHVLKQSCLSKKYIWYSVVSLISQISACASACDGVYIRIHYTYARLVRIIEHSNRMNKREQQCCIISASI